MTESNDRQIPHTERLRYTIHAGANSQPGTCSIFYYSKKHSIKGRPTQVIGFAPGNIELYNNLPSTEPRKPTIGELFLYASGRQLMRDHAAITQFLKSPKNGQRTVYIPKDADVDLYKRHMLRHIRSLTIQTLLAVPGALGVAIAIDAVIVYTPPGFEVIFSLIAGPVIAGRAVYRLRKVRKIITKDQSDFVEMSTHTDEHSSDFSLSVTSHDPKLSTRGKEVGAHIKDHLHGMSKRTAPAKKRPSLIARLKGRSNDKK